MSEKIFNKFTVIKNENIDKYLAEEDAKEIKALIKRLCISRRCNSGKRKDNSYFVVNQDEPYADLVKKLILKEITAKNLIPKILSNGDLKLIVNSLMENSVSIIAECEECKKVMGKETYGKEKERANRLVYLANVLDGRKEYKWMEEK